MYESLLNGCIFHRSSLVSHSPPAYIAGVFFTNEWELEEDMQSPHVDRIPSRRKEGLVQTALRHPSLPSFVPTLTSAKPRALPLSKSSLLEEAIAAAVCGLAPHAL